MRDKTYIMAFLIATSIMLLAGLSVSGYEIYQYTSYTTEPEATTQQPRPTPQQEQQKASQQDEEPEETTEDEDEEEENN